MHIRILPWADLVFIIAFAVENNTITGKKIPISIFTLRTMQLSSGPLQHDAMQIDNDPPNDLYNATTYL